MKKHILIFISLIALLIPEKVNEIGSGDMICGYVYPYTYTDWGCIVGRPMDTCDGQRVYLWNPPEYYLGHWLILFDPVWAERCTTCRDGSTKCDKAITTCSGAQYIRSCEDCGFPGSQPDPCKNVSCNPKCYGCDYWAMECDDGECVKDYIIESDSEECGCGTDPCKEDSDNDGVDNCKDRCPNTPKWMSLVLQVDSEGCLYCLDKETRCALSVTLLIGVPTMGIEDIFLGFCEIIAKLADGDYEGAIKEVPNLFRDMAFAAAGILAGLINLPAGIALDTVLDSFQTMMTCLPAPPDSEMEAAFGESVQMMANENIDVLSFYVGSPVTVEVTDDRGNTLSESTRGIPNSCIFTLGNQKVGLIVDPTGEYEIEVRGTGSGTYDLTVKAAEGGRITYDKKYSNIQTSRGEVNTYNVEVKGEKEEASLMYSLPLIIIGILIGLYAVKKEEK